MTEAQQPQQEDQPRQDTRPAQPVQAGAGAGPSTSTPQESNLQTSQPDEPVDTVEGDEAPPDFDPNPVDGEDPGDDDTGDMDLPEESFKADPDDDKALPHDEVS